MGCLSDSDSGVTVGRAGRKPSLLEYCSPETLSLRDMYLDAKGSVVGILMEYN